MNAIRKLPNQPPREAPAPALEQNRRILVVEDEPAIGSAYLDILSGGNETVTPIRRSSRQAPGSDNSSTVKIATKKDFEVTVVTSALQAITTVEHAMRINQPFAMGFFDVLLGQGMDGVELVKKLREIDPNILAVFVTAYSDRTVDSIQALLGEDSAAGWDYLNKPFTNGEILQKARSGVSIWNLRAEKSAKDVQIDNLQKRLLENERISAIATVAKSVTHEFGNVLTQILGRAELGRREKEPAMRESIEHIYKASQHAAEILSRFKHLANPQTSRREKKWFSMSEPLNEAVDLLSHRMKTGSIQVCRIKSAKPAIFGDPTALLQVFVNILVNAIHVMPNSGQIDLSVSEAEGWAEVRIRDYGPGVDAKILARVVEPYFTTKGAAGSGLGLAICKDIVEKEHDGRLLLRNHEVRGFEVAVQIPMTIGETKND